MTNTQYVSALAPNARLYVRAALMAKGILCEETLADAQDSRLCDLEDTLTARDLATIARLNASN